MWILFAQTSTLIAAIFTTIYFIPLFFQLVYADSALQAGVRLLPLIFIGVFFFVLSSAVMSKLGYYMPWYGTRLHKTKFAKARSLPLIRPVNKESAERRKKS